MKTREEKITAIDVKLNKLDDRLTRLNGEIRKLQAKKELTRRKLSQLLKERLTIFRHEEGHGKCEVKDANI